ncbi:MAG TPA: hypothetical protein DIS96_19145 [Pusillimonas sp.]|nr:hypothetical protein [Pusillimonas sp.]
MTMSESLHNSASSVPIEGHLFYWMSQAINLRNTSLSHALAPYKCTFPRWRVMNMLCQFPDVSIGQLAEKTAVDRTTLTRTVEKMESDGLIARGVRADNRRITTLNLTPKGQAFFEQILPLVRNKNTEALSNLEEDEVKTLIVSLKKVVAALGGPTEAHQFAPPASKAPPGT